MLVSEHKNIAGVTVSHCIIHRDHFYILEDSEKIQAARNTNQIKSKNVMTK